jgi:hypothetical protein
MDTSEKSRFGVPYGPDRYRRLNEHFQACADLPLKERETYLRGPRIADSGLREELRELLHYHAPAPIAADVPAPRRRPWWLRPLRLAGIGAAATLLGVALRTAGLERLEAALREEAARSLQDVVESRAVLLEGWARRKKELARSVLEAPDLALPVAALREAAEASWERPEEALRQSSYHRYVSERMSRVPAELGAQGFLVVGRSGVALCADPDSGVGRPPPPEGAAFRQRLLEGEWLIDGAVVGGPIRDAAGRLQAVGQFHFSPERELGALLSAPSPIALSLVDANGVDATDSGTGLAATARVPELERALRAELDLAAALAPARPLRDAFALLLPLPALVTLGLLTPTLHARFRRRRGPGSRLGSYVLDRPLGQGGMAEVVLGHHAILGRPAALKILHPGRVATARRFEQEARLASRLEHPNLVQVFEFGEAPDGRLYYAMEYVKGLTLSQLLALEGRLPVARALLLLRQIAAALEEAQRAGLLHRDLKPANIMVCRRGGTADVVKVLDFGIACPMSGGDGSPELVGTPAYLAPERIRSAEQRDPRSDVYSFGAVAFHLLTGRNVFEGASPAELLYQSLTAARPSASQIRGSLLPEPLEALIRNCLSLDPESRPSDFREIGELLRSVETPDGWSQEEARAWWSENEERVGMFGHAAS